MEWTAALPEDFVIAPDGSEIRLLLETARGGLSHCTLPPGKVSLAVRHQTIEEIWFFLGGVGEVWCKLDDREEVAPVGPGVSISLPAGVHFQFRNTGRDPLIFAIATMPPWPGMDEAVRVAGYWPVRSIRTTPWALAATLQLISSRCICIARVLAKGSMRAAPLPDLGQMAPNR